MELIDFLRARLDEDEAAARAATRGPWEADTGPYATVRAPNPSSAYAAPESDSTYDITGADWLSGEDAAHIARHDPARVLRDVEAKRRIVDEVKGFEGDGDGNPHYWNVLAFLALPCADHEDYDESWRPQ